MVKSVSCVLAVVLAGVLACGVPSALAESPWWHLTSGPRPSVLHGGLAQKEVQEVAVSATGGQFVLIEMARFEFRFFAWNASSAEVQAGLEEIYGSGNVEVTGGPGDATGSKPYVIAFTGKLAYTPVAPMNAAFSRAFLSCEGVPGCRGEATLTEKSNGRPDGQIILTAANPGDASTTGQTTIVGRLPAGVMPVSVSGLAGIGVHVGAPGSDGPVSCSLEPAPSCVFTGGLQPYHQIEMRIGVLVGPGAKTGETVEAGVTGGGASGVSVMHALAFGDEPVPFGVEEYDLAPEEEGGAPDTQAGSHPFQLTATLALNQDLELNPDKGELPAPVELTKDLRFRLPPGLIGNPTPFPQCTLKDFLTVSLQENKCPPQTAIGVARITINEPEALGLETLPVPLFSLEPSVGEPARFGFTVYGVPVFLDTGVRTGGDYSVTVTVENINQTAGFLGAEVTFWGVPGDPRHDNQRGWGCVLATYVSDVSKLPPCHPLEAHNPPPLIALPTSCTGPLQTSMEADSWIHAGSFLSFAGDPMPAQDGCNRLPFSASIGVTPDGLAASTPTGLTVGVHVPQEEALNANGLSPSQVRNTVVTLPVGVGLNPAAGDGLQACTDTAEAGRPEGEIALNSAVKSSCPEASKVGTVEVRTPLLPNPLVGAAYLAAQDANPFGSLVALYLVVEDPVSGSVVKLAGEVKPDPVTGQLVSTFLNTPQLPFEDLKLHFFGGSRAPLGTPGLCGSYTTTTSIAPWSGNAPAEPSSTFQLTSGPNNTPCQNPLPFAPELTAGSTNIQAGAYTPFTMTMSREDGNQNLDAVKLHMPQGLLGTLASVKLCDEAHANAGTCGPESLIGETIVSVGLGGTPFSVKGGRVYITGPYKGAPYGLSIVNPAKAGPFDLEKETPCDCVVVRAKIEVDPITAALTVTTDSTGPYAIPQILGGIPLQIKHVNVTIERQGGFTFNPTNCQPMAITGTLTSAQGATQTLAVPFQVTNCAVLAFKPKLVASTSGKTSRVSGASFKAKLTYPVGPYDANIARVKVSLPRQLPSRLTTLQKACTAATFEADPANCPSGSIIGHATATTPVLPVSLTGPAYFVSHGGEAFPSLIIVLQGYGVTVHLVGTTFINKAGITSSTFKTIPDVPVGTFELTLPNGPGSALAANGNLCKSKLAMPTSFVGQNGAVIHTSTPIGVTGCAKHKKAKKARRRHRPGRHH